MRFVAHLHPHWIEGTCLVDSAGFEPANSSENWFTVSTLWPDLDNRPLYCTILRNQYWPYELLTVVLLFPILCSILTRRHSSWLGSVGKRHSLLCMFYIIAHKVYTCQCDICHSFYMTFVTLCQIGLFLSDLDRVPIGLKLSKLGNLGVNDGGRTHTNRVTADCPAFRRHSPWRFLWTDSNCQPKS